MSDDEPSTKPTASSLLARPTLEGKIARGTAAEVLGAIHEVDILGFNHGVRPGRDPHQALEALQAALMTERIN